MAEERQYGLQKATYFNVHQKFAMIVGDASTPDVGCQKFLSFLGRYFDHALVDDDWVDAGPFDFDTIGAAVVCHCVTDTTKINLLEAMPIPQVTTSGIVALDTFGMGDYSGGAGVSYGTTAAQTDIDIIDNTHNLTVGYPLGNLAVQDSGSIGWVRLIDLAANVIPLAAISGDANKIVLAALPDGAVNELGNESPGLRLFSGMYLFDDLNNAGFELVYNIMDMMLHETRETPVARVMSRLSGMLGVGIHRIYPDLVAQSSIGVAVTSNVANFTYGNYATIAPAAAILNPFRTIGINIASMSDSTEQYQVELSRLSDNSVFSVIRITAAHMNSNFELVTHSDPIAGGEGVQARLAKAYNAGSTKNIVMTISYMEI